MRHSTPCIGTTVPYAELPCPLPCPSSQAIAHLAALSHSGATRPHLVVVPLSTLPNWLRELARFAPQLNVVALTGK